VWPQCGQCRHYYLFNVSFMIRKAHHSVLPHSLRFFFEERTLSTASTGLADKAPLFVESLEFFERDDEPDQRESVSVVLHGLLGTGRNLRGFINMLFKDHISRTDGIKHKVFLMDLRHHGKSNAIYNPSDADTLENAAKDVLETIKHIHPGPVDRIIGHSLGGKVALESAKQMDDQPCQVWTLDSFPFSFDESSKRNALGVLKVLETIEGIVQPLESREELYEILDNFGFSKSLQQWLGSNLVGNQDEGYVWNFHIPGAFDLYRDYSRSDFSDFLSSPGHHSFNLIRALQSGGWDGESIEKLQKLHKIKGIDGGGTHVHELDNAGHWLHAENPQGLCQLMSPHL
jgi:pimeloyl-ACP methyl ester carboxylesterase